MFKTNWFRGVKGVYDSETDVSYTSLMDRDEWYGFDNIEELKYKLEDIFSSMRETGGKERTYIGSDFTKGKKVEVLLFEDKPDYTVLNLLKSDKYRIVKVEYLGYFKVHILSYNEMLKNTDSDVIKDNIRFPKVVELSKFQNTTALKYFIVALSIVFFLLFYMSSGVILYALVGLYLISIGVVVTTIKKYEKEFDDYIDILNTVIETDKGALTRYYSSYQSMNGRLVIKYRDFDVVPYEFEENKDCRTEEITKKELRRLYEDSIRIR